jgi:SNF2 family DNA or RNA helicase
VQKTRHLPVTRHPSQRTSEVSNIEFMPHEYQSYAIQKITEQKQIALFLEPGLGKTVITLTAIDELMFNRFEIRKVLVVAPLRVAEDTWSRECEKWAHLRHLKLSKVLGSLKKREASLRKEADIYIINRENVEWLVKNVHFDFDCLVIDELSGFKSHTSKRFKALQTVRPNVSVCIGLTGTPTPNGLVDLWSQMFLIDQGKSLKRSFNEYLTTYFRAGRTMNRNGKDIVLEWKPKSKDHEHIIHTLIGRYSVSMRAKDWLKLPKRIDNIVPVKLDKQARALYEMMEKDFMFQVGETEISVAESVQLSNKLLQLTNGAVYDSNRNSPEIHSAKLDALEELMEAANGQPVLVFYSFQHDWLRIQKRFSDVRKLETSQDIADWNDGKVRVMCCHPASAGHGLNLQAGGNIIVWFGLPWSLELYEQANARLHRQGQERSVIVHHIIAEDTIDETVLGALKSKANVQDALLNAVKARIRTEVTA